MEVPTFKLNLYSTFIETLESLIDPFKEPFIETLSESLIDPFKEPQNGTLI